MITRPPEMNPFEFVRLASLRAAQLMKGCTARVPARHRAVLTARAEVAAGKVVAEPRELETFGVRLAREGRGYIAVPRIRR